MIWIYYKNGQRRRFYTNRYEIKITVEYVTITNLSTYDIEEIPFSEIDRIEV